ncbi:unnamed protein product [Cutaneotrichosporon oleaginosum]
MALTSADIYEGATLPDVMQDGRLSAVFALDPAAPTVKFMFTIRIPSTSDYAASEKAKFFLIIEVLPIRSGAEADAEARDNIQWLNKCAGQNASVQLGGLRVNRVVSEDNRRNVYCSAMGPREFNVRDHKKVLRKRSRIRTCPTWQFYTPSPAPQRPSRPDPRQRMRETSAELSPPRQQPRPTGSTGGRLTTPLDTPEGPRLSLAKPVPLAPQRSRSPRPLSTHALQFKSLKRPAEGGNDLEMRSEKRLRAEPPSAAAQAGPSRMNDTRGAPAIARPFPHPTSARPPRPHPPVSDPHTEYLDLGNAVAVPSPRNATGRQSLPSPSTCIASRNTLEVALTQESIVVDLIDFTHPSTPSTSAASSPQPAPTSAPAPCHYPHPSASASVHPRGPLEPPQTHESKELSVDVEREDDPEEAHDRPISHSRRSSSAAPDRAARRATLLAELRDLEEQERRERLAAERARLIKAHGEVVNPVVEGEHNASPLRTNPKHLRIEEHEGEQSSVLPIECDADGSEPAAALRNRHPSEGGNVAQAHRGDHIGASVPALGARVDYPPPSAAARAEQAATVISIRRMEEERVRQANATRIAKQREEEERLAAEASKLQEPFTSGKWIYKPLAMLNPNMKTDQHVMGVVVEVRQIRPTKGPDCALTLIIADPTTHTDGRASDDRQVTIMRGPIDLKAHDFDVGRPVLFRHLKITSWNGRAKGQAFNDSLSQWYVLRGKKALPGGQRNLAPIGPDEIMRLQALERWYREGGGDDVPAPMQGTSVQALSNTKFRTLGEIVGDQFFDTTVKIVHLIRLNRTMGSDFSPKYELYVCDGTVNPQATHNFHNIDMGVPPGALMCLTIFSSAPEEAEKLFEEGAILHFKNVRSKYYRGAIELKWSETVTDQQLAAGWKNKACRLVDPNQPEAVEIETRLKAMQAAHTRGEAISTPNPGPPSASTTTAAAAAALPPPVHPISTLLMTGYTDEAAHPRSTISEILANTTVPNRFRLLARVLALTPRFPKGASVNKAGAVSKGELAMLWCRRCKNNFPSAHCLSCNDMSLKHAEVRWQMLLTLEGESGGQLDVVLDGDAAAAVLPPLPPLTPDPKEVRRLRGRLVDLRAAAENVLLGARFDGVRTRPLIDWTIESYATGPSGRLEYLHFRVFGMRKGKQ